MLKQIIVILTGLLTLGAGLTALLLLSERIDLHVNVWNILAIVWSFITFSLTVLVLEYMAGESKHWKNYNKKRSGERIW